MLAVGPSAWGSRSWRAGQPATPMCPWVSGRAYCQFSSPTKWGHAHFLYVRLLCQAGLDVAAMQNEHYFPGMSETSVNTDHDGFRNPERAVAALHPRARTIEFQHTIFITERVPCQVCWDLPLLGDLCDGVVLFIHDEVGVPLPAVGGRTALTQADGGWLRGF